LATLSGLWYADAIRSGMPGAVGTQELATVCCLLAIAERATNG
jgi:hypothetical protein